MSEIDHMKLDMVTKLASLLMEEQPQLTMEQAISTVVNSDTYLRLQEDESALYYQSMRLSCPVGVRMDIICPCWSRQASRY